MRRASGPLVDDLGKADRLEHALHVRQRIAARRQPLPSRAPASPSCRRRRESGRRRLRRGRCRSPPRPARATPCSAISQPPPSASPAGATTTGTSACFSAIVAPWNARIIRSTSSQLPSCASSSSSMRLAPAEKFGAVVADDERGEVLRRLLDAGVQHLDGVAADRVHLRVELDLQHAVADVDEARARVRSTPAPRERAAAQPGVGGSWESGSAEAGELAAPRRVSNGPELPAEAPAHRLVDVVARVGDLVGDPLRVLERRAQRGAQERPDLVLARRRARGCDRRPARSSGRRRATAASPDCFGRYSSVFGSSVRISSPTFL